MPIRSERRSLLRLLQLASPALPIGAYAYSQGLEQAVARSWVTDPATLQDWLGGLLGHSLGRIDLPLLSRHYQAWRDGDAARALRWSELLHALRDSHESSAQETHLGGALARILVQLGVTEAAPFVAREEVTFAGMFALGAVAWEIALEAALEGYAFSWLENQVGAATRLFPLGQLAAQRVLANLADGIPDAVSLAAGLADDEIGCVAPALSLASAWHEQQYSRLFRS